MSYIWEEYSTENYYFIPEKNQSYYEEVWRKDGRNIPVNVYNRFYEIFFPMELNEESKEIEKKYKNDDKFRDIVNVIFHELCYFDRLRGITAEDIEMSLLNEDINNGIFGLKIKEIFGSLEFDDLYIILKELIKASALKNRISLFDEVLYLVFGKVIIYKEQSSGKTIVYIEQLRDEYRERVFELIVYLFADMGLDLEAIWANEHFGIIGNDSTMKIGKINVY